MREGQAARKLAIPPLTDREAFLLSLLVLGGVVLAGDRQAVVHHISVDMQVLLCKPRQLERRSHEVVLRVLVEIHPIDPTVSILLHYVTTVIQVKSYDLPGAPEAHDLVLFTSPMSLGMRSLRTEEFIDNGREIGEAEDRVVGEVSGNGHW